MSHLDGGNPVNDDIMRSYDCALDVVATCPVRVSGLHLHRTATGGAVAIVRVVLSNQLQLPDEWLKRLGYSRFESRRPLGGTVTDIYTAHTRPGVEIHISTLTRTWVALGSAG